MCGEKLAAKAGSINGMGSPPRMRGKVCAAGECNLKAGITPAYAGKSACEPVRCCGVWEHPRVCGEKSEAIALSLTVQGSPPRMRGKDQACSRWRYPDGITPAYAGKSCSSRRCCGCRWDHPRVCGEKCFGVICSIHFIGSPPRVRGKDQRHQSRIHEPGITPRVCGEKMMP